MHEQLSLLDIPKPPEPKDSLFLGIFLDSDLRSYLTQFARSSRATHRLQGKQLASDRFHISLCSLGVYCGVPESIVRAARLAAAKVVETMPPFWVTFERALSFTGRPDNQPFVLRDNGNNRMLVELRQRLVAEFRKCGVSCNANSNFTPHITLLYAKQSVKEQSIEPLSWMVNEFVLVHSLRDKMQHNWLARWTLQN